jgi:hypothetical protein
MALSLLLLTGWLSALVVLLLSVITLLFESERVAVPVLVADFLNSESGLLLRPVSEVLTSVPSLTPRVVEDALTAEVEVLLPLSLS